MLRFSAVLLLLVVACSEPDGEASTQVESGSSVSVGPSAEAISKADHNALVKMQGSALKSATRIVGEVTDVASAKAAKPELEKLAAKVGAMAERSEELAGDTGSVEDRVAYARDTMSMMDDAALLGEELERLEGVPGVRDVLEEPMQRILALFDPSQQ